MESPIDAGIDAWISWRIEETMDPLPAPAPFRIGLRPSPPTNRYFASSAIPQNFQGNPKN